jgi:hypothetical protein
MRDPRLDGDRTLSKANCTAKEIGSRSGFTSNRSNELDQNPKGPQKDDSDPADHSWTSLT